MTLYECWVRGCKENRSQVYELSTHCNVPESGFYKLTSPYTINGNTFYRSPVYIVWWNGKQIYSGMNYQEALSTWNKQNGIAEYENGQEYINKPSKKEN